MARPLRVLELLVSTDLGGGPAQVREVVARLPREEFAMTVAGPAGVRPDGATLRRRRVSRV